MYINAHEVCVHSQMSICISENIRQFWIQDNNFYSLLESTKWLKYISYCLQKTVEVCERLNSGISVILQGRFKFNT